MACLVLLLITPTAGAIILLAAIAVVLLLAVEALKAPMSRTAGELHKTD